MMKKILAALLSALFCAAAMAQVSQPDDARTLPPPQNRHQADERERQGNLPRLPPPAATERSETGAINPATGQYYPPAGNGDVINPSTGERYLGIPGGYVNPNTGELMPRIR
jgi:hypothetical protein